MLRNTHSITAKKFIYKIIEIDLNSPIEKIQKYENLDLEPFEESPLWSNDYLFQLNIQHRSFGFQTELVQCVIKSKNVIVCLRTGADKSYISALLIKYYYMKKRKENSSSFYHFSLFLIVQFTNNK